MLAKQLGWRLGLAVTSFGSINELRCMLNEVSTETGDRSQVYRPAM